MEALTRQRMGQRSKNMVMDSSKLEKKLKININLIENEIYKEANRVQNEN